MKFRFPPQIFFITSTSVFESPSTLFNLILCYIYHYIDKKDENKQKRPGLAQI